jgi:tetratricopeptide (TPR) repeat protein
MRRIGLYISSTVVALTMVASVWADDNKSRQYDTLFLDAVCQREAGNDDAAFDLLTQCIAIDSTQSEAYYYLAQYEAALKNDSQSLAYFEKAAELNPDNSTYLETLSQSYISNKMNDKAITALEKLYDKNRDRSDVLAQLVQLYTEKKDYDNAIRTLDRMEVAEGKSERISYAKSGLYTQAGNQKAAIAEIKKMADEHPNDLNYQGMYGDMLLMNNQVKKAVTIFQDILQKEPDNSHAQMSMRSYYKEMKDTLKADSITMHLLLNKNTDTDARIYVLRQEITDSETADGDSTKVLNFMQKLMDSPVGDAETATLMAAYMDLKKMPKDKIKLVLEHILKIAPDNAAARLQLVGYALNKKDFDAVIKLCEPARQYNPDEMAFYYYQGMAYFNKDETEKALSTFRNGISVIGPNSDPAIVSDFYAMMGELLHQQGKTKDAFAAYDSCLQYKPDDYGCLNNYAYYLSVENTQLDKAEMMSAKVIKAEPKNATYLDTYAWILFKQKRYAEAKIYIDQTLQCDSDHSGVLREHAGDIYSMNGDTTKALEYWNEALQKDPQNKSLIRKIKIKKYIKE